MVRQGKQGFIWLPRDEPLDWNLRMNSADMTQEIYTAEFTKGLCPEIATAKIELINADGTYSDLFRQNQLVEAFISLTSVTPTDATGFTYGDYVGTDTAGTGVKIQPNDNCRLLTVTKDSHCTATRCVLQDVDNVTLATAIFSGNDASFDYALIEGSYYKILCDNDGPNVAKELIQLKFNGDATDSSGNGYDGTETDITYTTGKIGQAAVFNGSSSMIEITGYTNTSTALTYMLWINKTRDSIEGLMQASDYRPLIYLSTGAVTVYWAGSTNMGGSPQDYSALHPISNGIHHIAFTSDGSTYKLYIDGALVESKAFNPSTPNANRLFFGEYGSGQWFKGWMDDARVIPRALTAEEIATIYNAGSGNEGVLSQYTYYGTNTSIFPVKKSSITFVAGSYLGGDYSPCWNIVSLTTRRGKRFSSKIDSLNNQYTEDRGYVLEVMASQSFLFSKMVTQYCNGDNTCDMVFKDIAAQKFPQFSVAGIEACTKKIVINWDNKPFWDCVADLCKASGYDAYLDEDNTFQFFKKGSRHNTKEAIIWNDTAVEVKGLVTQSYSAKNKITVIGDDGSGLPVIYTSENTASQATLDEIREQVIFDSKVQDQDSAKDRADSEVDSQANPELEGEATALVLPSLQPGEIIWISDPTLKVHGQYRIYSFTHKFNEFHTICNVNQERKPKQIMKKRVENELASQKVTNPFCMTASWNLPFNNISDISTSDPNVQVSNGIVSLSSGTQGVFTCAKTLPNSVSKMQLKVASNNVTKNIYELSTDGGGSYQTITPEYLSILTKPGNSLVLRVTMQGANTEIDSIALLYL